MIGIHSQDALLQALLERNGDVYLLLSDGTDGSLHHFIRAEDYQHEQIITSGVLQPQLPDYVNFSVDKFGHIKLFRSFDRDGVASILSLLNRIHPRETATGPVPTGVNPVDLLGVQNFTTTPAGWRYVISANGDEGWMKVYNGTTGTMTGSGVVGGWNFPTPSTNTDALTGGFRLAEIDGKVKTGDTLLPPHYKTYPTAYALCYHAGGFWTVGSRTAYVVEADGTVPFTSYNCKDCCGPTTFSPDPINDWGCGTLPYSGANTDHVLWNRGTGNANSFKLSPPLGALFMIAHCPLSTYGSPYSILRAATIITDVSKSVKVLTADTFLTAKDNALIKDYADSTQPAKVFGTLAQGQDYYDPEYAANTDYSSDPDNAFPVSATVTYASTIKRWNHCGDLCGSGPIPSTNTPPPPPQSDAWASSYGKDQSQQKMYMIKMASFGPDNIETFVVQLQKGATGSVELPFVADDWSLPADAPANSDLLDLGDADPDFTDLTKQVIYNATAANLGATCPDGTCPDYTRALGFSKRRDGSKDYVYFTNLPPSHFTVSSNFWGTGGTIWYAEETGGNLILNYQTYNHTTAGSLDSGSIPVGGRLPLKSIAADGDNNVYIVHSKDAYDSPKTMEAMFTKKPSRNEFVKACEGTRALIIKDPLDDDMDCATFENLLLGFPVPLVNAKLMEPYEVRISVRQYAGFVLEKMAPIEGSSPEVLGVIPQVALNAPGGGPAFCTNTFQFPLDGDNDPAIFHMAKQAKSDTGWVCDISAGDYNSQLSNVRAKLQVVNVPNPPSSGSNYLLDIVDPCYQNNNGVCDANHNIFEDTLVKFNMENPPHFAGVPAVLAQSSDPNLRAIGIAEGPVTMISNYTGAGIEFAKSELGGQAVYYYDDDSRVGITLATFLNVDRTILDANTNPIISNLKGSGATQGLKTMRYRWQVRSHTPPHSLVDYSAGVGIPFQPSFDGNKDNTPDNHKIVCNAVKHDGTHTYPEVEDPYNNNTGKGLLYDTCWHDFQDDLLPAGSPMYAPPELDYNFTDPGEYSVTLMVAALSANLEGITFLSDPQSVASTMIVTYYAMPVTVGPQPLSAANNYVTEVEIPANSIAVDQHLKVKLPTLSGFRQSFANKVTSGGVLEGDQGTAPLYPVHYFKDESLVSVHQNQLMPMYGVAKIKFFGSDHSQYLNVSGGTQMTKTTGAGVWDFSFPCPASMITGDTYTPASCGLIDGVPLVDKSNYHPGNFSLNSAGNVHLTTYYGNDARADQGSSQSSRTIYQANGGSAPVVINPPGNGTGESFRALHQGTVARDQYLHNSGATNSDNFSNNPYAFYTWYDIKYAWFIRYRQPDGTIHKRILRTGNLAEMFMLNYYANKKNQPGMQELIKNIAPSELENGQATLDNAHTLIQKTGDREYYVRVPLLNRNAMFNGTVLDEGNGVLSFNNPDTYLGGQTAQNLLAKVRPLKWPIPTGTSVLEIGFQIYSPLVGWQGQKPIYNDSGDITSYTYFDAVSVIQGPGNTYQVAENGVNDTKNFCFDTGECVLAPMHFGSLRETIAGDVTIGESGLALSNTLGGFTVASGGAGGGQANFGFTPDHFVNIVVNDLQNPIMDNPSLNLNVEAGKSYNQDETIGLQDNNPYAHWLSPDGSITQEEVPSLTQVLYQIGHDPKNRLGLGLLNENSYGFLTSHRQIDPSASLLDRSNLEAGPTFKKDEEAAKVYPGKRNQGSNIERVDFHYPNEANETCVNRCDDRTINFQYFQDSLKYEAPNTLANPADSGLAIAYWNKPFNQETIFPPLSTENYDGGVSASAATVYNATISKQTNVNYKLLTTRFPAGSNLFQFPEDDSNKKYIKINDIRHNNNNCLDGILPDLENSANCYRTTTWTLERDTLLAPYFFHGDVGQNYNIYAVGQDARLYGNYVAPNTGQNISISDFHYRLAGKTNTPYSFNGGLGTELAFLNDFQNKSFQVEPNLIGSVKYSDVSSPQVRISLRDYKTNNIVYYAVTHVPAINGPNSGSLAWSDKVNIYRSVDSRSNPDFFNSSAINQEKVAPQSDYRIATCNTADLQQCFYQVPEDTRFEVRAEFSDNVTGEDLLGSITIESSHCIGSNVIETLANNNGIEEVDPEDKLATSSKTIGYQYQDKSVYKKFHRYPRQNKFDEIKVSINDSQGNNTTICIPIHIIPQQLHFRSIGQERRIK